MTTANTPMPIGCHARTGRPAGSSGMNVGTPETAAERICRALPLVPAEGIAVAPDRGVNYPPRDAAFGKLMALTGRAKIAQNEVGE